jgi:hypothetical protein
MTGAEERNYWPFAVKEAFPDKPFTGQKPSWQAVGPLVFSKTATDGSSSGGFRPFYVFSKDASDQSAESDFLYPLLSHRTDAYVSRWSFLELINSQKSKPSAPPEERQNGFDVWPFYFSRNTGDPVTSYHAVFPLQGTIINRLGYDSVSWTLFPLYGRFQQHGVTTTDTPWPFIKTVSGNRNHGFAFWPLFGWQARAGDYRNQFYLWPLIYKNESKLSQPKPTVNLGVLPFYARDESADSLSETYVWPFFGYTHRTAPYHYDETRWLWPLFVQGRGDDRRINRWAPFYTHSDIKGDDKTWVLWPFFRRERWTDGGLTQTKTQVLYFFFWSLGERSVRNPALPRAEKTHFWPLTSYWSDGAHHRQLELLSPFEVFFQDNEPVRRAYSPLFSIYRYEQFAPDNTRTSLLWNAVSLRRAPAHDEFHLGPVLSVTKTSGSWHISLLSGLIGLKRDAGKGHWIPFAFDFFSKSGKMTTTSAPP